MTEPLFRFLRVEKAVEQIRQEHPRASEPLGVVPQTDLSKLIERILGAPPSEYPEIAGELTRREATILVHAYQRRLTPEQHGAITEVLVLRPLPRQLTQAWIIVRNHPDLTPLKSAMRRIAFNFARQEASKDPAIDLLAALWSAVDFDRGLIESIEKTTESLEGWSRTAWPDHLALDPAMPLFHRMQAAALAYGSRRLLGLYPGEDLAEWFVYVPESLFDAAAANYIQQLDERKWSLKILERCVDRHGLPAAGDAFWLRIDEPKRMAIQRLIAGRLIAEFFRDVDDPSGRFRFWQNYVDRLISIAYPLNRERVMLHFRGFIIVEFQEIGNAGYVYEESARDAVSRRVTGPGSHASCKIPELALHRIIHNQNWQRNTKAALDRNMN